MSTDEKPVAPTVDTGLVTHPSTGATKHLTLGEILDLLLSFRGVVKRAPAKSERRSTAELWLCGVAATIPWLVGAAAVTAKETGADPWVPGWTCAFAALPALYFGWRKDWLSLRDYVIAVAVLPMALGSLLMVSLATKFRWPRTLAKRLHVLARKLTGVTAGACYLALLPAATLLVLAAGPPWLVKLAAVALVVIMEMVLICAVRWASNPLRPFTAILQKVQWCQEWADQQIEPTFQLAKAQAIAPVGQLNFIRLVLVGVEMAVIKLLNYLLRQVVERWLVATFCLVLFALFTVVTVTYGLLFHAIQVLEPPPFTNLDPSVFRCIVFSLSVLTTAPVSNVVPESNLASFTYAAELSCTFLLITVFFTMFSTAISYHGDRWKSEIKAIQGRLSEAVGKHLDGLAGEPLEIIPAKDPNNKYPTDAEGLLQLLKSAQPGLTSDAAGTNSSS